MIAATQTNRLYTLSPRAILAFVRRQPPSFLLVLVYLFFEYVRPQNIYSGLQGLPFAKTVIFLALIAFVLERRRVRLGVPEVLLGLFALIVLASSLGAFYPSMSYASFVDFYSWVVIYLLIANVVDTEDRFLVFVLCFLLYSFKMSQFGTRSWAMSGFAFREWGTTGAPGFFQNSGEFGIQMCIFLPLIVAFIQALGENWPRWLRISAWIAAATAVTGIVGSSSRGAVVGAAAVALWIMMKSRRKLKSLLVTIVLAVVVYAIVPAEQKARFEAMGQDATSVSRTTYWRHGLEMMRDYPILGIGYANWPEYHDIVYGRRALPHNIFIQAGAELGISGLLAFIALLCSTFFVNHDTRRLARLRPDGGRFAFYMAHGLDGAMVGFVASGFFVTVLYYPYFWINLAMTVALNNAARRAAYPEAPLEPGWRTARSMSAPLIPELGSPRHPY
jgi:probable O-glycosylation ligase (exosortase A-associated)